MSDQEVQITTSKGQLKKTDNNMVYKAILAVVAVIVIGVAGFFLGVNYQKNHVSSTTNSSNHSYGPGGGRFGGMGNRAIGTVSSISPTSITISERSGATKTYTINSSTVISDGGSTTTTSDIKTGDTVFVTLSSSSSTTATRIIVNPSFGGFGGGGQPGSSTNGSSTSSQSSNTNSNTNLNVN